MRQLVRQQAEKGQNIRSPWRCQKIWESRLLWRASAIHTGEPRVGSVAFDHALYIRSPAPLALSKLSAAEKHQSLCGLKDAVDPDGGEEAADLRR